MDVDESTGLPSFKKFEIETAGGDKATLLYTASGIWEYGEENIQTAFSESVDEAKVFVLISAQDIALDVLHDYAVKNNLDPFKGSEVQAHYLHEMFSPHLGEKFNGLTEEEQIQFWKTKFENRDIASNHAETHSNGLVVINVEELSASKAFGFDRDTPLSRLFLLGHEFDHADNLGKFGFDSIGVLKSETHSDNAGFKSAEASGHEGAEKVPGQVLFYRSREAIIRIMAEETADTRSGWDKFFGGSLLDEFDHATSATLTPEGDIIPGITKDELKKSLLNLREKITEHVAPSAMEDGLNNIIEDFAIGKPGAAAMMAVDGLEELIKGRRSEDQYKPFIDNFDEAVEGIQAGIKEVESSLWHVESDDINVMREINRLSPAEAADMMAEKGLDEKYPELHQAYKGVAIHMENAQSEMKQLFSTLKENDPNLFERFLEKGEGAKAIFAYALRRDSSSPELNTALHKALSEMKANGAFEGDPIQQRFVDAYLNGPNVKPDEFESGTAAPLQPTETPAEPDANTGVTTTVPAGKM